MVVVAIIGVMAVMAAPSMWQMVVNNRISTTASDLVVDLTYARATAIQRGVRVGACRSTSLTACDGVNWQDGWMIYTDAASDGYTAGTDTILRVRDALASGMTVVPTDATARVTYRPSGPSDAARTFLVCNTGFVGRNIAISTTGRINSTPTAANCP